MRPSLIVLWSEILVLRFCRTTRITDFRIFDPALYNASAAPQVTGAGNRVVGTGNFCNGITVNSSQFLTGPNNAHAHD